MTDQDKGKILKRITPFRSINKAFETGRLYHRLELLICPKQKLQCMDAIKALRKVKYL
jgi:hypothetical protein